jgi:hypothetical protein
MLTANDLAMLTAKAVHSPPQTYNATAQLDFFGSASSLSQYKIALKGSW